MSGLLERARKIRRNGGLGTPVRSNGSSTVGEDGISLEEHQRIEERLEEVASGNRIDVTPQTFSLKAARSGIAMPLTVNLLSVLALIAGGAILIFAFQQSETQQEQVIQELQSTEGRVLEVLKQEAEANLAAKEAEISEIQNQLVRIQQERQDLEANFASQLAAREAELTNQLESELEAERQRLRSEGLSSEEIEAQIAQIRLEKEQELAAAIQSYSNELEAERAEINQALSDAESRFANDLQAANDARSALEAEAQARESELQAQLAEARQQNTRELEQADAAVQQAQEALANLQAQRETEQNLITQLNGFYSQLRTQITNENYGAAEQTLTLLRSFLNSAQFLSIESLRTRRDTEIFLADTLSSLVNSRTRSSGESQSLSETARMMTGIQSVYAEASQAAAVGNSERAVELYEEALTLIPEVAQSYEALQSQWESQLEEQRTVLSAETEEAEAARLEAEVLYTTQLAELEARLTTELEAQTLLLDEANQRIAQLQTTNQQLNDRITQLNTTISRQNGELEQLQARVAEADAQLESLEAIRGNLGDQADDLLANLESLQQQLNSSQADNTVLNEELDAARIRIAELETARESDNGLTEKLQTDLAASQVAISERDAAITNLEEQLSQAGQDLAAAQAEIAAASQASEPTADPEEITRLETRVSELETTASMLQQTIDERNADLSSMQTNMESLQERIAALTEANDRLERELEVTETNSSRLNAETRARIANLQEQIEQLSEIQESYDSLLASYSSYRNEEAGLLDGNRGLLQGKLALDRFLADETVQEAFPGFLERIQAYDQAFLDEGARSIIYTMADAIYDVYSYPDTESRLRFIDEQYTETEDEGLKEFYVNLRLLILDQ